MPCRRGVAVLHFIVAVNNPAAETSFVATVAKTKRPGAFAPGR